MTLTSQDQARTPQVKILQRRFGRTLFYDLAHGVPDISPFGYILERYSARLGDQPMPIWKDFEIRDMLGWHADMILVELAPDMSDATCRILGERIGHHFTGVLKNGAPLSASSSAAIPRILDYFQRLLTTPAFATFTGRMDYDGREHVALEMIDLPLAARDGKPKYILSFGRRIKTKETL